MSFLLMYMGTALIYPQSGTKGLFDICFWNNCAFVFCGEGEKRLDFLAILDLKHLYMPGPCA